MDRKEFLASAGMGGLLAIPHTAVGHPQEAQSIAVTFVELALGTADMFWKIVARTPLEAQAAAAAQPLYDAADAAIRGDFQRAEAEVAAFQRAAPNLLNDMMATVEGRGLSGFRDTITRVGAFLREKVQDIRESGSDVIGQVSLDEAKCVLLATAELEPCVGPIGRPALRCGLVGLPFLLVGVTACLAAVAACLWEEAVEIVTVDLAECMPAFEERVRGCRQSG